jgi:hypothetical protein
MRTSVIPIRLGHVRLQTTVRALAHGSPSGCTNPALGLRFCREPPAPLWGVEARLSRRSESTKRSAFASSSHDPCEVGQIKAWRLSHFLAGRFELAFLQCKIEDL